MKLNVNPFVHRNLIEHCRKQCSSHEQYRGTGLCGIESVPVEWTNPTFVDKRAGGDIFNCLTAASVGDMLSIEALK